MRKSPMERFLNKIEKTENCWIWKGAKKPTGYGNFYLNKSFINSSMASWILHFGNIKKGMYVCHKCDNPSCVNPNHLFLGTPKENQKDMYLKKRDNKIKIDKKNYSEILYLRNKGNTYKSIGDKYGVSLATIYLICKNYAN